MVAMVIFALVSSGILVGMLSVLKLTRDSRAIQVASNLAAEQIDLARAADDLFLLDTKTLPVRTINGETYTIVRTTEWITNPDTPLQCGVGGAGGAPLRYKAVTITVTWNGMAPGSEVQSYTVINPSERINDPTKGTIIVSVTGVDAEGVPGVTIGATPSSTPNGAAALAVNPSPTDSSGCSYVLKVTPGNYDVTATKSGYIDDSQKDVASKLVQVSVGTSVSVQFSYDRAITVPVKLASNYTATTPRFPTNLDTTFASSYGNYSTVLPASNTIRLYPISAGYEVMSGKIATSYPASPPAAAYPGCTMVDPKAWATQTILTQTYEGKRQPPAAGVPGTTLAQVGVPMGIINLKSDGTTNQFVKAVSVDGTPRCADTPGTPTTPVMSYTFGQILSGNNVTTTIALPPGNWKIYTGANATTQGTLVGASRMSLPTGIRGTVNSTTNEVQLDPRTLQP